MFNIWEDRNITKKGKLAKCWMAATSSSKTFHRKFKSSTIKGINISEMCDEIRNVIDTLKTDVSSHKCNLNLSSQLVNGAVKILSYQTSILDKELDEIEKMLSNIKIDKSSEEVCDKENHLMSMSTHSAQLDEDLHLLPDESDIDIRFKNKMDAVACLDFGALTEEELAFFNSHDGNDDGGDAHFSSIFSRAFERMQITHPNVAITSEISDIKINENLEEMLHSLSGDDITLKDQENRVEFLEEIEPRVAGLQTPQKRQPNEERHTETPSKRRRLRFDEAADKNQDVTVPLPETEALAVSATDHPLELLQDLQSVDDKSLQIKRKSSKKREFADENTKLSYRTIRKWLNNVNAHTVPLKVIDMNITKPEILFKSPSTSCNSMHKKKWNNSLQKLFSMHNVIQSNTISKEDTIKEDKLLIKKPIEFLRSKNIIDPSKSMPQLPELSAVFERSLESNLQLTRSFKEIGVAELVSYSTLQKEQHTKKTVHESYQNVMQPSIEDANIEKLEEHLVSLSIEQSVHPDLKSRGEGQTNQKHLELSPPIPLTKQEVFALLEVKWHDVEIVEFGDVFPPISYSKSDAIDIFLLLLELHQEKKITLEQAVPEKLWIKKYSNDNC